MDPKNIQIIQKNYHNWSFLCPHFQGGGGGHTDLTLSIHPSVFFFFVARNSKSIIARMMKLYELIDQHVNLCTCIFWCSSYRCQWSYSPFFSAINDICGLVLRVDSKSITARVMKLNKPIDQHVNLCTYIILCSSFRRRPS